MADNVMAAGASVATDEVGGAHYQRVKLVDGTAEGTSPLVVGENGAHVDVRALPPVEVASLPAVDVASSPGVTQEQMLEVIVALTEQLQQVVRTLSPVAKLRISGGGRLIVDTDMTSTISYPVEYVGSGSSYSLRVDNPNMTNLRWMAQRDRLKEDGFGDHLT